MSILLDGTGSVNNRGTTTTYAWSLLQKPATSNATLTGETTAKPTFIPDINGVYTFQLTVNDGTANSQADTINITSIPVGYITLGNTPGDVSHIQGTPTSIDPPNYGYTEWSYDQHGLTYIRFSTSDNKVISWQNYNGSLKVQ